MIKTKRGLFVLVLTVILTLSACESKVLNGSYKSDALISQTWTFYDTNKLKMTAIGGTLSFDGTYEIDGNEIVVRYSVLGESITLRYVFENRGQTLLIDGTIYSKI